MNDKYYVRWSFCSKLKVMDLMEKIVSLCKRRGFVFPGSEIYGGMANSWDFGPVGAQLKKNIKDLWWKTFVESRDDVVGLDATIIMNPKVWEASGHIEGFSDPLVECKSCHNRFRADQIDIKDVCSDCGKKDWSPVKNFNLMLKTFLGPAEDSAHAAYLRPETAQAMFVDFKNVLSSNPKKLPFGIAQMGKAFRNEITTGNFLFRLREFEMMEIEYFVHEKDWKEAFEMWRKEMWNWFELMGIDKTKIHEHEIPDGERAHYSQRTIDFEFEYPFGQKELYGLAYRTDYDLKRQQEFSGQDLSYAGIMPHVIEPTWGVDRTFLAVMLSAYHEDEKRVILKLHPKLAPYKVAVFPLVANKENIVKKAREVYQLLKPVTVTTWDDRGNIGKRYYAQDEIGTPWCVTIDYQTLKDDTVTVRDRDTAQQVRVAVSELDSYFPEKLK
ncbi:MAG: Glycine-tRNA ligase [Candidatus Amesbacteria bacterium GW2011_GWB1_47_26]|uniref:glycine--tRNA ligase n=1 Tax=Candidatus Amesbacteria bacterium GW2011_GWC2_45_19 TaxID=1618366 RepID=A0A0G1M595_9BACT|nr:MAG: Glycine-tRNA ligase [Candidatus Amesbacteria bacterium GW2011_GWC2_45_19]KKU38594.1 MAG: Glycine-tRNA ligase [Candidatus Amesbacteria bacterium GW2011_GWA1_46_35]KKU69452.1 MAG: Glycine-tRNA ligase [Microgenomates group bacterium GW2011_GWC1_47_20]KKU74808.1 MAG: Glycine-tRNA ligase [Candidatus Amesbacteria bacterium GW2011_GWB1_47_26]